MTTRLPSMLYFLALTIVTTLGMVALTAALMLFVTGGAPLAQPAALAAYGAMLLILAKLIHHWTTTQ